MSDQTPPTADAELCDALTAMFAQRISYIGAPSKPASQHYSPEDLAGMVVQAVRPLLDAVTAERDSALAHLRSATKAHLTAARERDQARAALRGIASAEGCAICQTDPRICSRHQNPATVASAALAGDVKEPAESFTSQADNVSGLAALAALADRWEAEADALRLLANTPTEGTAMGLAVAMRIMANERLVCAAELRAALGGADPKPPEGEPTDRIDGAEVLGYPPRPPLRDLLAGTEFADWLPESDPEPTEPEPSPLGGVLTDCTGNPITRPASDPQPTEPEDFRKVGAHAFKPGIKYPIFCRTCGNTTAFHARPASDPDTQEADG